MRLGHDWISSHIPHQGAMCLIDEVLDWTATEITCRTASHRLESNPLRTIDRLRSECGIEYAAQAIAIHAALRAAHSTGRVSGVLAAIRGLNLHVDRLDDLDGDLKISGVRIGGDGSALLYDFSIACGLQVLLDGRATIAIRQPAKAAIPGGAS